jgi:hypothetical protein
MAVMGKMLKIKSHVIKTLGKFELCYWPETYYFHNRVILYLQMNVHRTIISHYSVGLPFIPQAGCHMLVLAF